MTNANNILTPYQAIPDEIMTYYRDNIKADLFEMMRDTIEEKVTQKVQEASKSALEQVNQEAEKLKAQLHRQEAMVGVYKQGVKDLHKEISSMAHKKVEEDQAQEEKDKKILLLEKRIAEMELERVNIRLDDLDKQAKNTRDIKLLKAALITVVTGGLGVHTLIGEGCDESSIRRDVRNGSRYHEAVDRLEKSKEDCARVQRLLAFERRHDSSDSDLARSL
jgi:uncharacterized protein YbjQ (UPF0145 family)